MVGHKAGECSRVRPAEKREGEDAHCERATVKR